MTADDDYLELNRRSWNARVEHHVGSAFYDTAGLLAGRSSLAPIERALLGDVRGKSVLHLQCHFGQDTVSLARLGARATGVDLSDRAIAEAEALAAKAGVECRFVCCDVYDVPRCVPGSFDVVFTSYGVLGWLPDLARWAAVVAGALAPGGRLVLAEFHPFVWIWDARFERVEHRWFRSEAIREVVTGSYAAPDAALGTEEVSWNHGLGEVVTAVLGAGLELTHLEEHDHSPWACFEDTVEQAPGVHRLRRFGDKVPLVYSLAARKRG